LDQISAISGSDNEISSQDVEKITGTVDSSFLFRMANCLIDGRFDELIDLCQILNASGKNQVRFTLDLASYFRDLLIIRVKADPVIYLPYPKETIKDMYQTAAKVSADTLTGYISYLSKEYAELRKSPDIATSFELMLMRLCGRKSTLPVTPIVIPDFEKKQAEKAKTVTEIEERTSDLNQKRGELNEILAETKEQTETLMIRAGKLEGNIEERLLAAFKRLRKKIAWAIRSIEAREAES
jgi:DNA polymerase III gamma/tau subunit